MKFLSLVFAVIIGVGVSTVAYADNDQFFNDVLNDRKADVKEAIEKGQNPNILSKDGHTPIIVAIRENNKQLALELANNQKVDVNFVNSYDETPLMYAAITGNMTLVEALVKRGANINKLGWSPLHYAAATGKADIAKYLLDKGALPNAPAVDGSSPLISAVQAGSLETIQVLLDAKADPRAVDENYKSALDYAKEKGLKKIYDLMSKYDPRK